MRPNLTTLRKEIATPLEVGEKVILAVKGQLAQREPPTTYLLGFFALLGVLMPCSSVELGQLMRVPEVAVTHLTAHDRLVLLRRVVSTLLTLSLNAVDFLGQLTAESRVLRYLTRRGSRCRRARGHLVVEGFRRYHKKQG